MKRTISMILVAVMLILSLVSCGYSIANEDISAYATFSSEDKAKFEQELKKLLIEDGDFTADPETRKNKLEDSLYAALAGAVSEEEKKTEGTPAGHDLVYYAYYCTAKFGNETVVLFASSMKSSTPSNFQLGLKDPTDLEEKLASVLKVDFKDKTYTSKTSGTTVKGDVAFVTYTYTYTEKGEDGIEKEVKNTVKNGMITIGEKVAEGKTATTLEEALSGKNIAKTLDNFKIQDSELGEVSYSDVKIDWVAKGAELATVKDVTFDEEKNVTDTNGTSRNLKDVELTYHVYPVGYVSVPEYTAENIVNIILGKDLTADIFYEIMFGEEFLDKTEEEKKETLDKYVTKDEDGKDVTLQLLIETIAKLQTEIESAESTLETAKTTLKTKQDAYDKAKKAYDDKVKAEGEDKATAEKDALDKADKELNGTKNDKGEYEGGAKNAVKNAETTLKGKNESREKNLATLFGLDGGKMKENIELKYKESTEKYLIENYENEIKMNIAKEVFYFLKKYIKVTGTPEKAVEETYKQLIENYEHDFYNGTFDNTQKISNYKQYKGDFKAFLVAKVSKDVKTVKTYDEAVAALREEAKVYVEPVVLIYAASEAYGVVATEEEYEAYKEDTENNYSYNEYNYGANSVRYAYQFDKLMNHILNEGETAIPNDDGVVNYNKLITYKFGTPASSLEETEDEGGDDEGEHDHDHEH